MTTLDCADNYPFFRAKSSLDRALEKQGASSIEIVPGVDYLLAKPGEIRLQRRPRWSGEKTLARSYPVPTKSSPHDIEVISVYNALFGHKPAGWYERREDLTKLFDDITQRIISR